MVVFTAQRLKDTVIDGGYCIGCGVCAGPDKTPFDLYMDKNGFYQARLVGKLEEESIDYTQLCPFAENAQNETSLAQTLFSSLQEHPRIGRYDDCYAGWVKESDFREKGSSGGFAKWILCELFVKDEVDYVIQVHPVQVDESHSVLYEFQISSTEAEIRTGGKSVYYPVEMSEVLAYVRQTPGRYAITGVPCFIKAIRLLTKLDKVYQSRIQYCIGIVCGHLKSTYYAKLIGWQLGVSPHKLHGIDFRHKIAGAKANEKGVYAVDDQGKGYGPEKVQNLFGTSYGHGFFKYKACDYCDDVLAETADVAVGDAWLPQYMKEGTSVLVVRNPVIGQLLKEARRDERIVLDSLSADEVARSQDAGLRHRREGLAYRLWDTRKRGKWVPLKRVEPDALSENPAYRKKIQLRVKIAERSIQYFERAEREENLPLFIQKMSRIVDRYETEYVLGVKKYLVLSLHLIGIKYVWVKKAYRKWIRKL